MLITPYFREAFDDVWMLAEAQGWIDFLDRLPVTFKEYSICINDALYEGRDWIYEENLPEDEERKMLEDMVEVAVFAIEDFASNFKIHAKQGVADFKKALQADGEL